MILSDNNYRDEQATAEEERSPLGTSDRASHDRRAEGDGEAGQGCGPEIERMDAWKAAGVNRCREKLAPFAKHPVAVGLTSDMAFAEIAGIAIVGGELPLRGTVFGQKFRFG